jgi:ubiquinol-cytochrome c reductase cytochrome b subunit
MNTAPKTASAGGMRGGLMTEMMNWVDARFPATRMWNEHIAKYYAPKNFNFWYYFGSLALLVLVIQIVTGIWLTMNYKPDADKAFESVEYIMRDVDWGWLIRYMHSTGASAFFVVIYLHMFRGLMYGSYKSPRELVWLLGMMIYLALMGEAFFGYLLPWGQMSFWGAKVIVSLFGAIPLIGEWLSTLVRGDYGISDVTLNRFFAFHVIAMPLVLAGLVVVHILALHEVGSNNPDGVEIKKKKGPDGIPLDGIPFHPYYTVKDIMGTAVFLLIYFGIVFFAPEMGGYFLEHNNFIPADGFKTPAHIAPVWYFTPYYSVLRATTSEFMYVVAIGTVALTVLYWRSLSGIWRLIVGVGTLVLLLGYFALEAKFWGVVLMGLSVLIFCALPWLDRSPVKSIRYRGPLTRIALAVFVVSFLVLGYLGTLTPTVALTRAAQFFTVLYFAYFLLMPLYSAIDSTKPVPERVTH